MEPLARLLPPTDAAGNLVQHWLGNVVLTTSLYNLPQQALMECLTKHSMGEWGALPHTDAAVQNQYKAQRYPKGCMLMSVWTIEMETVWIVTHAGISTTIMLREEY